jgi:hypothetical protein
MRASFITIAIISVCAALAGCGGGTTPANTTTANTNTTAPNSTNPLETKKNAPEATTNNAPTLTPAFKAYCEAKKKDDEAALRKIYSAGTLKSFESQMKAEKIKTLTEFLKDDRVSDKLCEISNEKITGDRATALIKYDSYPNGVEVVFVKENGEWKMTNESPTFQSVKQSNSNSAPAK